MSTKIYDGYRIGGLTTTIDLFALVADFRQRLQVASDRAYLELVGALATTAADAVLVATGEPRARLKKEIGPSPLWHAIHVVDQAHRAIVKTGRRDIMFDLQCDLAVMADPADPQWIYAIIYAERDDYIQIWAETPGVESWPYWDNTDRPDGLDEQQWQQRADIWDRVLQDQPPARIGLIWTLLGDTIQTDLLSRSDRIAPYILDKSQRAAAVIRANSNPLLPSSPQYQDRIAEVTAALVDLTPQMLLRLESVD